MHREWCQRQLTPLSPELESLLSDMFIVLYFEGECYTIEEERLKDISKKLLTEQEDRSYIDTFRHNLFLYIDDPMITIKDVSEISGVPASTINTILYGKSKDVKLSTVILIAKALNISIDEIVGCGTMEPKMRESVKMCRGLPEHSLCLIRYFIRHQSMIYSKLDRNHTYISVLMPIFENGIIPTTNVVEPMQIDNLPEDVKSKVYIGLKIPTDAYMPYYQSGEVLLIASDRHAQKGEQCIVTSNGGIYIVEKMYKDKEYRSIVSKIKIPIDKIDDKIGYVVGFLNPDLTWGIR